MNRIGVTGGVAEMDETEKSTAHERIFQKVFIVFYSPARSSTSAKLDAAASMSIPPPSSSKEGQTAFQGIGRIVSLKATHGMIQEAATPKRLIFFVPSSVFGQIYGGRYPDLTQTLQIQMKVSFKALSQPERKGQEWVAIDGTVKPLSDGSQSIFKGTGLISRLDQAGNYGFILSNQGYAVYFNVAAVRPETKDVHNTLKVNQHVYYEATESEHKTQNNCKHKGYLVCVAKRRHEFETKRKPDILSMIAQKQQVEQSANSSQQTSTNSSFDMSKPSLVGGLQHPPLIASKSANPAFDTSTAYASTAAAAVAANLNGNNNNNSNSNGLVTSTTGTFNNNINNTIHNNTTAASQNFGCMPSTSTNNNGVFNGILSSSTTTTTAQQQQLQQQLNPLPIGFSQSVGAQHVLPAAPLSAPLSGLHQHFFSPDLQHHQHAAYLQSHVG